MFFASHSTKYEIKFSMLGGGIKGFDIQLSPLSFRANPAFNTDSLKRAPYLYVGRHKYSLTRFLPNEPPSHITRCSTVLSHTSGKMLLCTSPSSVVAVHVTSIFPSFARVSRNPSISSVIFIFRFPLKVDAQPAVQHGLANASRLTLRSTPYHSTLKGLLSGTVR